MKRNFESNVFYFNEYVIHKIWLCYTNINNVVESRYFNQETGSSLYNVPQMNPLTTSLISTAYIQAHVILKKNMNLNVNRAISLSSNTIIFHKTIQ